MIRDPNKFEYHDWPGIVITILIILGAIAMIAGGLE